MVSVGSSNTIIPHYPIQPHFTNFKNTLPGLNQFVRDPGYYAGVHRLTRLMTDTTEGEHYEIKSWFKHDHRLSAGAASGGRACLSAGGARCRRRKGEVRIGRRGRAPLWRKGRQGSTVFSAGDLREYPNT